MGGSVSWGIKPHFVLLGYRCLSLPSIDYRGVWRGVLVPKANGFIFVLTSNCCLVYLWLVIYVKHDISILLQWKCKDSCMDFAGIQDWTGLIFTAKILQDQPRWDRDFGEKKKEKDKKIRIEHADIQSLTQSGFSRDTRDSVGWLLYYLFFLSSL